MASSTTARTSTNSSAWIISGLPYPRSELVAAGELAGRERELADLLAALPGDGDVPSASAIVCDMVLDVTSIRGPEPDTAIRPDGMLLRAEAWSPGRDHAAGWQ